MFFSDTAFIIVGWFLAAGLIVMSAMYVAMLVRQGYSGLSIALENALQTVVSKITNLASVEDVAYVNSRNEELKQALLKADEQLAKLAADYVKTAEALTVSNNLLLDMEVKLTDVAADIENVKTVVEVELLSTPEFVDSVKESLTELDTTNAYEAGIYNGMVLLINMVSQEQLERVTPVMSKVAEDAPKERHNVRGTNGKFVKKV